MTETGRARPILILLGYLLASFSLIVVFRFIFPQRPDPLEPWVPIWRFLIGLIDFIKLFPALSLSAIVLSYAKNDEQLRFERFSELFWEKSLPRLAAILVAALLYSGLYLLALPAAYSALTEMETKSALFYASMAKASKEAEAERWREAGRYMTMCEGIWPDSPATAGLRDALAVNYSPLRAKTRTATSGPATAVANPVNETRRNTGPSLPGVPESISALEALELARRKLSESAAYDAHWLALLARRLAPEGSPEQAEADLVASAAWNAIELLKPESEEATAYAVFKMKRDAYAMAASEDWLGAYYLFAKLRGMEANDPDIIRYLEMSNTGVLGMAFFVDELETGLGSVETNVVLSLPAENGGRIVIRANGLYLYPDFAYAEGLELLSLKPDLKTDYHIVADYAKFLPTAAAGDEMAGTTVLLRALDRNDEKLRWEPRRIDSGLPAESMLHLPTLYDDLSLAARARRRSDSLTLRDLLVAGSRLGSFGYATSAFQAETVRRLAEPFSYCVLAIWILAYAWRLRPKRRIGIILLPMLFLLPFVLNIIVQVFHVVAAGILVYFVLSLPYAFALAAALGFEAILMVVALVFLAGQRA